MMKQKAIYQRFLLLAALPAFMLASCSQEETTGGQDAQNGEIRFEIGFAPHHEAVQTDAQTRVATDAAFNSTWEDGDEIGVFAVNHGEELAASGNYFHNVKLTYRKADNKWMGSAYWPTATDERKLDFYAYYPYDAAVTDPTSIAFSVHSDQSATTNIGGTEKSNYNLSDLLVAKANNGGLGYACGTTVSLAFTHALAMVQVTLDNTAGGIDPNEIAVSLLVVKSGATLNLGATGTPAAIVNGSGDNAAIKMYRIEQRGSNEFRTSYTFRALVPVQSIAMGQIIFRITNGDLLLHGSKLTSQLIMAAGKAETFTQKIPSYVHRVSIPAGTFQMGSPDSNQTAENTERPSITIK